MTQVPSITINCQRTCSNLLQLQVNDRGVALNFIEQTSHYVVAQDFLPFSEYPELKELVTVTAFDTVWDGDLLWSIASLEEDHAITPLGHYTLHTDSAWKSDAPDFTNLPAESSVA